MTKYRKLLIVFLFIFFISVNTISQGYSYWDNQNEASNETLPIGTWNFLTEVISSQVATDITSYVDSILAGNSNSSLQYIYSQSGNFAGTTATVQDIDIYEVIWDITGTGTNNPDTMGYVSLIDRAEDGSNNLIHPTLTDYTTSPSYPEYNYFTSSDVNNTLTNNQYSLRLNYGVTMTSDTAISNLSNISFYASRGLSASNDPFTMTTGRTFTVSISTDGVNWVQIGSGTPSAPSSSDVAFTHYSYDVPVGYQGQNLYLQILFNGQGVKSGKNKLFSRMVIDELIVTTN